MIDKKILTADLVLLVGSLVLAGSLFSYVNYGDEVLLSPGESSSILFEISGVNRILVDDNYELASPKIYDVKEGVVINLEPGEYYWRLDRNLFSEIRKVETNIKVSFVLKEVDKEKFLVVNADDSVLNVDKHQPDGDYDSSFTLIGGYGDEN